MLRAFLRTPAQHVCRRYWPALSSIKTPVTRSPAARGGLGRRVARSRNRNSNQVYENRVYFEHGWERRGGLQLGINWKRWMSTNDTTSARTEFPYEDIFIGEGRNGAVMGVRVFRPPPQPSESAPEPEIPLMIFYPSGLPVYIPPNSHNKEDIGSLLVTENDHNIAAVLAVSSRHTVVMPGYFVGSKHILEQLYPKAAKAEEVEGEWLKKKGKTEEVVQGPGEHYYGRIEEDYGDIDDFIGEAVYDAEAAESELPTGGDSTGNRSDGSGWVYPYPKHPAAGHFALRAYECILQNLPILLNLSLDRIPPGVSLSMSGSLIGAGLASSIALSEFKHPPFTAGVKMKATTLVPGLEPTNKEQVILNVELKSLALVTPLINWCFEPLGGYDFNVHQGTGQGWLLPPVPPLPHLEEAVETEPEGGRYVLPAPTLPTLLRLRNAYFKSPEDYIDPFASPLFFLQTPGMDVGKDALARLWVSLQQQILFSASIEKAAALKAGKKIEVGNPTTIDIITIEGTKRRSVWRRWPPAWGKGHVDGIVECRRGGLPRKGRIRVIVPGEGESEDGSGVIWGEGNAKKPLGVTPTPNWSFKSSLPPEPSYFPKESPYSSSGSKQPYIIAEHSEYAQDNTPVEKYTHSAHTISLLKNRSRLLSRITSPPLSTRSAGWWLISQAGDFVGGIDRSWRSVVSADRNLRRKLEIEKEEREAARVRRKKEIMGSTGFLRRKEVEEEEKKQEIVKVEEEEVAQDEDEEVLSLMEVIGGSEGVDEKREDRIKERVMLEKNAVERLGMWVAEVGRLP